MPPLLGGVNIALGVERWEVPDTNGRRDAIQQLIWRLPFAFMVRGRDEVSLANEPYGEG